MTTLTLPHVFAPLSGSIPLQYIDDNFNATVSALAASAGNGVNADITALNALAVVPAVVTVAIAASSGGAVSPLNFYTSF